MESELPLLSSQVRSSGSLTIEKPKINTTTTQQQEDKAQLEFDIQLENIHSEGTDRRSEVALENSKITYHVTELLERFSLLRKFLRKDPNQTNSEINPNGLLGWIQVLRQMKDHDLKEICGTDVALYIVFLRLSAKFFAWLTVFNCAVLIPLYVTGYPGSEAEV